MLNDHDYGDRYLTVDMDGPPQGGHLTGHGVWVQAGGVSKFLHDGPETYKGSRP